MLRRMWPAGATSPTIEHYPPRTGPAHPWLCRPCDIEWYGPEGSTCFYCDQPGVRR